jgi:mRNA-degrading endonuclease toxin of MazEF toxin-antitoxin module
MEKTLLENLQLYLSWIYKKIVVNNKPRNIQIKEGMIYWCSLGENVGDEESGKGSEFRRPVLVVKKFSNNLCWALPLSTKFKPNNKYYFNIDTINGKRSVILSQLKVTDTKRFGLDMGSIARDELSAIKNLLIELLKHNPGDNW